MRKVTRAALALAGSAALIGVTAVPSFAAATGDTTVTVAAQAGDLAITIPAAPTLSRGVPGADSTVTLAATKVTDERAGIAAWTATVTLPTLSNGLVTPNDDTIATTFATYLAVAATLTGGPTMATPTTKTDLSTAKTSQTASATDGNNTASWTATLTIPIPDQALAIDTYSGTLTQSLT